MGLQDRVWGQYRAQQKKVRVQSVRAHGQRCGRGRGTCLRVYSVFEMIKPNGQTHRADSISQ